jgi:hypothetical protein
MITHRETPDTAVRRPYVGGFLHRSRPRLAVVVLLSALLAWAWGAVPVYAGPAAYSQDFETTDGTFVPTGDIGWGWGTAADFDDSVTPHSGAKMLGIGFGEDAAPSDASGEIANSTPIAVPAVAAGQTLRLSFWAYPDFDAEWSRGAFSLSADGVNWTQRTEFLGEMQETGWQEYAFDVTSYAGGPLYLKFYAQTEEDDDYSRLFIDDIAVQGYTAADADVASTLTLTARETASGNASCPWVFTWNGSTFVRDNDVFPVMRTAAGEGRDFYFLAKPLVARDGSYPLEVREVETEDSWTDMVGLKAVDHAADVAVGTDAAGHVAAYKPAQLLAPATATDQFGADVKGAVEAKDAEGARLYSGDTVEMGFGGADVADGARLIVRMKGFLTGSGAERPFTGQPALAVEVPSASGGWTEVGRMLPRIDWSVGVFDLTGKLPAGEARVRVRSISHSVKYQLVDFVGLSTGTEPATVVSDLALEGAKQGGADVTGLLSAADDRYVELAPGNRFSVEFATVPQTLAVRDFMLVTEGYYVPKSGTFFVYTWDGSAWKMRDAVSFATSFETKNVDLSAFLPDPDGEYKVRLWQDYYMSMAQVDGAEFTTGGQRIALHAATDLAYDGIDVYDYVLRAEDGEYWAFQNRGRPDRWMDLEYLHSDLEYDAGAGGSIDGTASQAVTWGGDGTEVVAVPGDHYHFTGWSDGVDTAARTDTDVRERVIATAEFEIDHYSVNFVAGPNGTIGGPLSQTVTWGFGSEPVTATPGPGYHFAGWSGTGGFQSTANPLTLATVSQDMTITARFETHMALGTPKLSWIVRRGRLFRVLGALRPAHKTKSKWIVLSFERRVGKEWRVVKNVVATSYSTGSPSQHYAMRTRLKIRGRYRVRAYHALDADGPATWTGYNVFLVR